VNAQPTVSLKICCRAKYCEFTAKPAFRSKKVEPQRTGRADRQDCPLDTRQTARAGTAPPFSSGLSARGQLSPKPSTTIPRPFKIPMPRDCNAIMAIAWLLMPPNPASGGRPGICPAGALRCLRPPHACRQRGGIVHQRSCRYLIST